MRVIEVTYSNGYCGCDVVEYLAFSHKRTDREIDSYCQEMLNE